MLCHDATTVGSGVFTVFVLLLKVRDKFTIAAISMLVSGLIRQRKVNGLKKEFGGGIGILCLTFTYTNTVATALFWGGFSPVERPTL